MLFAHVILVLSKYEILIYQIHHKLILFNNNVLFLIMILNMVHQLTFLLIILNYLSYILLWLVFKNLLLY